MKYLKVLAALGIFALAGAGSAVVLESFGTISGTADVKPALRISEVKYGGSNERLEIYNPSDASVNLTKYDIDYDTERGLEAINSTEIGSGEIAVVVEGGYQPDYVSGVNYFNASTLTFVDTPDSSQKLRIETEDNSLVIDEVTYSSECGSSESYHRISVENSTLICDSKSVGSSTKLEGDT